MGLQVPAKYTVPEKQAYFEQNVSVPALAAEIEWTFKVWLWITQKSFSCSVILVFPQALADVPSPVVLSHNDLLCQNIIFNAETSWFGFVWSGLVC